MLLFFFRKATCLLFCCLCFSKSYFFATLVFSVFRKATCFCYFSTFCYLYVFGDPKATFFLLLFFLRGRSQSCFSCFAFRWVVVGVFFQPCSECCWSVFFFPRHVVRMLLVVFSAGGAPKNVASRCSFLRGGGRGDWSICLLSDASVVHHSPHFSTALNLFACNNLTSPSRQQSNSCAKCLSKDSHGSSVSCGNRFLSMRRQSIPPGAVLH